ncbi:hypothetical protein EES37_34230 [Streptomyces sp. ADI91-18]|nr:hypothetical protein EES37_34230 [Streptomyces sp. ADI91-18]
MTNAPAPAAHPRTTDVGASPDHATHTTTRRPKSQLTLRTRPDHRSDCATGLTCLNGRTRADLYVLLTGPDNTCGGRGDGDGRHHDHRIPTLGSYSARSGCSGAALLRWLPTRARRRNWSLPPSSESAVPKCLRGARLRLLVPFRGLCLRAEAALVDAQAGVTSGGHSGRPSASRRKPWRGVPLNGRAVRRACCQGWQRSDRRSGQFGGVVMRRASPSSRAVRPYWRRDSGVRAESALASANAGKAPPSTSAASRVSWARIHS